MADFPGTGKAIMLVLSPTTHDVPTFDLNTLIESVLIEALPQIAPDVDIAVIDRDGD